MTPGDAGEIPAETGAVAQAVKERDKWKKAYDGLLAEADRQGPPMYSAILARAEQQAEEIERLRGSLENAARLAETNLVQRAADAVAQAVKERDQEIERLKVIIKLDVGTIKLREQELARLREGH